MVKLGLGLGLRLGRGLELRLRLGLRLGDERLLLARCGSLPAHATVQVQDHSGKVSKFGC